jgi:allantoinase
MERLGAVAKCAPPLRPGSLQEELWTALLQGHVDMVASDHSPTEPARKAGDFFAAWGGIAGVQSTLPVLVDRGYHGRGLALDRIADLTAARPARRFAIENKGSLAAGHDADLVLLDAAGAYTLDADQLQQRHRTSPYVGMSFRGRVQRTIRRGETVFADGIITARTTGRLVRPRPDRRE